MTDNSLPNQPSVSNNDDSYVSSYNPPSDGANAAPAASSAPAAPSASPPSASDNANNTPSKDPLAELEKALKEYEERQKQAANKQQQVTQQANDATKQDDQADPLAELEKVLDDYEARYQQAQQADDNQSDKVLTQSEYQSILKNEPVKPATEQVAPTVSAPAVSAPAPSAPSAAPAGDDTQVNQVAEPIEQQNIFELLGVMDANPEEKEAFLDELQQALWEDFLDKDVELLVNADQLKEIKDLRSRTDLDEKAKQEQLIAKVEQLVPDVEEIMLEKALELKEDMVRERIAGMKEYYAAKQDQLTKIQQAEQQISTGHWHTGAQMLNSLAA